MNENWEWVLHVKLFVMHVHHRKSALEEKIKMIQLVDLAAFIFGYPGADRIDMDSKHK